MTCYRNGGCGPYEMLACNECPASKPEYADAKIICEHKSTFEQYEPSIYICSRCQEGVERYYNFCPNCGAKFNKEAD